MRPGPNSAEPSSLRSRYRAAYGRWDDRLDAVVEADPGYAEAFVALAEAAAQGPLSDQDKALVLLGCDAAVTYRNRDALEPRIRTALDLGAPAAAVLEVLELVSVLGVHALNVGLPLALAEYGSETGAGAAGRPLTDQQRRVRNRFEDARGYWDAGWDDVLRHATDFLDSYTDFSAASARQRALGPKTRELVLIAIDAASTHLHRPGIAIHVRNARAQGATFAEVLQVLQLLSLIGIESCVDGVPLLRRELARRASQEQVP